MNKEFTKGIVGTLFSFLCLLLGSAVIAGAIAMVKTVFLSFFLVSHLVQLIIALGCLCSGIVYRQKWYDLYKELFSIR